MPKFGQRLNKPWKSKYFYIQTNNKRSYQMSDQTKYVEYANILFQ